MSFQDLPPDWNDQPLSPDLHGDVVDLFTSEEDRFLGCLVLLVLDAEHRVTQPIVIGDLGLHAGPEGSEAFFTQLRDEIAYDGATVLVARGRRGPEEPSADDAGWEAFLRRHLGELLLGFYVATPGAVVECRPGTAAA